MTRAEVFYLLPYFASLALSLGILYYTWERRAAKGVTAFTWYTAGQTLWIFGFILELLTSDLFGKILWDGVQWLAGLISVIAFPIFTVQYTEYKFKKPQRMFVLSLIIPVIFAALLTTDGFHHLIYPDPHLTADSPFPELLYDFTWVVYGYALYSYGTAIWAAGLLVQRLFGDHYHRLYHPNPRDNTHIARCSHRTTKRHRSIHQRHRQFDHCLGSISL
jgi:hypothetical protein